MSRFRQNHYNQIHRILRGYSKRFRTKLFRKKRIWLVWQIYIRQILSKFDKNNLLSSARCELKEKKKQRVWEKCETDLRKLFIQDIVLVSDSIIGISYSLLFLCDFEYFGCEIRSLFLSSLSFFFFLGRCNNLLLLDTLN